MIPVLCLIVFWAGVFLMLSGRAGSAAESILRRGPRKAESVYRSAVNALMFMPKGVREKKTAAELLECLGYLKNTAVLGRSSDISAQTLLSELSDISNVLSPVFEDMARYLSVSDRASAEKRFTDGTGLEISAGLAGIIAGWDDLPPSEILSSVEAFITVLKEERETGLRRRDEMISDLIYFPVVLDCMLILMDFVYISFFIPQRQMLSVML